MRKLIILLDLDDVLNDQNMLWINQLNARYGFKVKYEDITDWNMSKFYPGLTSKELYSPVLNPSLVRHMSPETGSAKITREWHNRGHTLIITTATSTKNVDAKCRWLKRHYDWFTYDRLILTHKKQLVCGDILIDDGVHNLLPDKETGIEPRYVKVCFDRPWNRSFDCIKHGIHRVHSFAEIDKIIRQLENEEEIV